jgi:hypothetical protein
LTTARRSLSLGLSCSTLGGCRLACTTAGRLSLSLSCTFLLNSGLYDAGGFVAWLVLYVPVERLALQWLGGVVAWLVLYVLVELWALRRLRLSLGLSWSMRGSIPGLDDGSEESVARRLSLGLDDGWKPVAWLVLYDARRSRSLGLYWSMRGSMRLVQSMP